MIEQQAILVHGRRVLLEQADPARGGFGLLEGAPLRRSLRPALSIFFGHGEFEIQRERERTSQVGAGFRDRRLIGVDADQDCQRKHYPTAIVQRFKMGQAFAQVLMGVKSMLVLQIRHYAEIAQGLSLIQRRLLASRKQRHLL